jgi:hypothetical protein
MADKEDRDALAKSDALLERTMAVIDDANNSRPGSREALRKFNNEYPTLAKVTADTYGNLASNAEKALVRQASGGNVLVDASTRTWLTNVQSGLAEPADTALEEMLVHRVSLCWFALNNAETTRANRWNSEGGITHESADFWDRHVSRLNADLLKATRALATVRKLRRPAIQVNLAENQVNVANVSR